MIAALLLALSIQQWVPASADVPIATGGGHQIWADCYGGDDGRLWVCWSSSGEVYARPLLLDTLLPAGPVVHVNVTTWLQQDEPQIVRLLDGRVVVAWSDRSSQWTGYMSAQFAVLSAAGQLLVPETPLWSQPASAQTSWAPLLDPTSDGGFLAAWTGGWGEDSFGRRWGPDLLPWGPEFQLHPDDSAKHDSPDLAETADCRLAAVHMDGFVPTPKDITLRWLDATGVLQGGPDTAPLAGNQWMPHVAADSRGLVVAVWDDQTLAGGDVYMRRWSDDGSALGLLEVLDNSPGQQRDVEVELARNGRAGMAVWEDRAGNTIRAQPLGVRGAPLGPAFTVNGHPLGALFNGETGRRVPDLWVSADGQQAVIVWTSASAGGGDQDGWARRFIRGP